MEIPAIQGIRHHAEKMQRHASNLQDFEKADLPADMVGMIVSERGYAANVTSLKTSLRMQDAILDLMA